jgi:hypothetical protein
MELTFKQLVEQHYGALTEELHKELKDVLNAPENDRDHVYGKLHQRKLNNFASKVKDLAKRGEDTGLEGGAPKKGSSRAVYFPTDPKHITIDGHPAEQKTAVKVAFAGALDKHTGDHRLLGEHQNGVEADHFTRDNYSMLRNTNGHHYEYNPHGVTAPVLDHHEDDHWLEMGHADKLTGKKFTELTKTESHPKGLKFEHFHEALMNDHNAAHGNHSGTDAHDHVREHPLYEHMQDFIQTTGNHPVDLRLQNMGVWKHPVSGKEHPVVRDYGYSNDIAKLYTKGRMNSMKATRGR